MRKLYSLIVLFTIILLSSCAKDEVNPFGNIYGVVVNSNTSEPIQGARVTLTPTGKSTVTGNDGSYEFVDLEAGQYKVTIQANGYTSTLKNVTVVAGERAIGDVSISPKPQNSKLGVNNDLVLFTKSIKTTTIKIQNLGNSGDIDWTITNIPSWLKVSPVQGSTGVGKETAVALSLNSSFTGQEDCVLIINAAGESVSVKVSADTTSDEGNSENDNDDSGNDDYNLKITSCDTDIEVGIISCKRSGSNVTFKFYVINKKNNDINDFYIYGLFGGNNPNQIYDNTGKGYTSDDLICTFAGENTNSYANQVITQLIKDLKIQGEIIIKGVPEDATKLHTVKLKAYSYSQYNFSNGIIDIRNVPIE